MIAIKPSRTQENNALSQSATPNAKKPAPRIGAKRAPARAKEGAKADGEKKPARKAADAPAPKTTVKRARKIVKDDGGEKKE